jgi:hypothetical protein
MSAYPQEVRIFSVTDSQSIAGILAYVFKKT